MDKRLRTVFVALALVLAVSCGFPRPLPTVEPTTAPATEAVATPTGAPTQEASATPEPTGSVDDRELRQNLLRATVQIIALVRERETLQPLWTGSGTILSPDGMILTNAHVATDSDPDYQPDALGVAITVRSDDLPELKYLAEIRAIDYDLDLAVIQIASDLSGNSIDPEQLGLAYVTLGDSDVLELGDLLHILGYPGIGGETITFTEGVVSGFTREPGVDGRAYVKTDATIAGGNSGGLAANLSGEIVGVPTQVGYGGAERFADCRYLADTNGDGYINANDNCIPVGGFINAIRPVNLAKPLVEAARLGIAPATPSPKPKPGAGAGEGDFFNLVFAPAVDDNDRPKKIVTQLSSSATDLYACWEYSGMVDGTSWEARWYLDGVYQDDVSWTSAPWKGGEDGSWWVSVYNDEGLLEGQYRLELYVAGELLLEGEIQVGGGKTGSSISNLIFSDGITGDDRPANPSYLLPSGITEIYAFFDYTGMVAGSTWQRAWYREGREIASKEAAWDAGSSGSTWIGLRDGEPLAPGDYRLEIHVAGALAATSGFAVAGTQDHSAIGPITFAAGQDSRGEPVNPGTTFASGLAELRYFVDYAGMQDGMAYAATWFFDGEELLSVDLTWDAGESGTFTDNLYRKSGEPLWDGEYTLEIEVAGQLVQRATATVGSGGASPPAPVSKSDGLFIRGYILDADTGRGIPGAFYIVLTPGIVVADWDGDDRQVYTAAEADANGYFELPDALVRGESYSIIVWTEGYRPVTGDAVEVGDEVSPYDVEITLQKE